MVMPLIMQCGQNTNGDVGNNSDGINSAIYRAPSNPQQILNFLNESNVTENYLKYSVKLTITQSKNIQEYKNGDDGIYGTTDDKVFSSI